MLNIYFFQDKMFHGSNPIISRNKTDTGTFFTILHIYRYIHAFYNIYKHYIHHEISIWHCKQLYSEFGKLGVSNENLGSSMKSFGCPIISFGSTQRKSGYSIKNLEPPVISLGSPLKSLGSPIISLRSATKIWGLQRKFGSLQWKAWGLQQIHKVELFFDQF